VLARLAVAIRPDAFCVSVINLEPARTGKLI
jgi:hypothetical protein